MKSHFITIIISILTTLIVLSPLNSLGQKVKTSQGIYQLRVENSWTKEEARAKVEQLAKIDAIRNAFGDYVEQEANITIHSGKSNFDIIGMTKVKGEWIKTIDKNFTEETRAEEGQFGKEQTTWITCKIKGKVKKATQKANIEYAVLNNPISSARTTSFYSGEQLYLNFKSPINGYLSVFLEDDKNVSRLLPYQSMNSPYAFEVMSDEEYLLFSQEHNEIPGILTNGIDEIVVETDKSKEFNTLYILFSEKKYLKPVLNKEIELQDRYYIPKSLTKKRFREWLTNCKISNEDFLDVKIPIEIISR